MSFATVELEYRFKVLTATIVFVSLSTSCFNHFRQHNRIKFQAIYKQLNFSSITLDQIIKSSNPFMAHEVDLELMMVDTV
jgi:cytochrome c556